MIAFGALDAARRVGVRVPDELSIVGFDDIDMAGWEGFNLTTIRQPLAEMGRAAASLLLERIASDDDPAPAEARLSRRAGPPRHARDSPRCLTRPRAVDGAFDTPAATLYAYVGIDGVA